MPTPIPGKARSKEAVRRDRSVQRFLSSLKVFLRVVFYSVCMMLGLYLLALALFLLSPSEGNAAEADTSPNAALSAQTQSEQDQAPPVYDASLGGGSGILPVGLSEDDATVVTIARLESADEDYDETLVSFRGEVVGEPVNSSTDGSKWVLVQSSGSTTSSIEVLMTDEQVAQIQNWGSYQVKGATVRVTGIYRVADANNTGALDVTAYVVTVVDEGGPVEETPVDAGMVVAGLALSAAGALLTGIGYYLRKRSRS